MLRLLENPDAIWSNVPEDYQIWYLYGAWQKAFDPHVNRIKFFQGWSDDKLSEENLLQTRNVFFIIGKKFVYSCLFI